MDSAGFLVVLRVGYWLVPGCMDLNLIQLPLTGRGMMVDGALDDPGLKARVSVAKTDGRSHNGEDRSGCRC
jgi:hypothetical protein